MSGLRKFDNSGSLTLPWATAQDENLSFLARGVLAYVLSLPDGWAFSIDRIAKSCKATVKGSGREAVTSAMRELEDAGYRRVVVERDEAGRTWRVPEFAYRPVPEWAEAAAEARARRSTGTRTPGTRTTATPRTDPPGETPGQTESGDPGLRQPGAIRGVTTEGDTHNAREVTSPASAPPAEGVCGEPDYKTEGARAVIGWNVEPEHIAAGDAILTTTTHPEVAHLIGAADRDRLAARAGALLARGWSRQRVERVLNRRTNAQTVAPVAVIERALNEAIKESLTPRAEAERRPARPTRARIDKASALADRLYPDEKEFAALTRWFNRASAADVDKWIAEHQAEAEAAPLHIPMTNAPATP